MIDIETHRIIDLISSRDCDEVVKWLKSYPNIQIVSRDGSITYKKAITLAHPNAIQVSDRFHILKNLTSYCKDYLMQYLEPKVVVDVVNRTDSTIATLRSPIQNKQLTLEEKITKSTQLLDEGIGKSQICKQLNMDIRVFNKLSAMSIDARLSYLKSSMQVSHEENVTKKIKKVSAVRDMYNNKYSIRAIARELRMSNKTITKYLDDNFSAVNGNYNIKKKSILDPFIEEINELIDKNYTSSEIENIIRLKGYNGSGSTIRHYRTRLKKSIYETCKNSDISSAKTELVERYKLLKLLYNPVNKVKGLSIEYVNKVNMKYPKYKEIIDLVGDFRTILKGKSAF